MPTAKQKRQSKQIFNMTDQYFKLKEEEWEIRYKECPWMDPEWCQRPENQGKVVGRDIVEMPLPEERKAIAIKIAAVHNELMKLMEDAGWSK